MMDKIGVYQIEINNKKYTYEIKYFYTNNKLEEKKAKALLN